MTEIDAPALIPQEHVLLHELNHRINNEFAAAIGNVTVAAARSGNEEVKAALTGVAELLHRYADVHRFLQMPDHDTPVDTAAYLRQLCLAISRSRLDAREISLVLSAQPLRLQAERCWRLGMIVHELISNAARHAFEKPRRSHSRRGLARRGVGEMQRAGQRIGDNQYSAGART